MQEYGWEQIKEITQVEGKDCKGTVISHMGAAKEVGVTGTPSLILESGYMIPGYVEPNRLLQMLDQMSNS